MWCPQVIEVEMAQAASGPDLGGPLTIFLVVGFHRAATNRPLMLKKTVQFFWVERPLGGNKSEWNHLACAWRIFPMLHFQANLLFPYVSTPSGAIDRGVQDPDFRTRVRQDSAHFQQTGSDRTTVLFKFPDQDEDFQISLFWDLTPTQS